MNSILYKSESYTIVGLLFEVHKQLGGGFSEIVYKDALTYEFLKNDIPFEREKQYEVHYKDVILDHKFYADIVLFNKIILEVKAVESIHPKHVARCLNYLHVSGKRLVILANFNGESLVHQRIIK